MSEMIERLAKGLFSRAKARAFMSREELDEAWRASALADRAVQASYRDDATDILVMLREPTNAMLGLGPKENPEVLTDVEATKLRNWHDMIDAATGRQIYRKQEDDAFIAGLTELGK